METSKISQESLQKLKDLMVDKVVAEQFGALKNLQEMHEFLKERGLDLSPEEIFNAAAVIASEKSEELDEDLLDSVAGGKKITIGIFVFDFQKPKWWPW